MIEKKTGKVIKGLGGLYNIALFDSDDIVSCRAKGVLRRDEDKLFVGDDVELTLDTSLPDSVVVSEILARKNSLIRPPLANLDYIFITVAAKRPAPVLEVIDKLVAIASYNNITPVLVITKLDLDASLAEEYAEIYKRVGILTFITSSEASFGVEALREYIGEKIRDGATAAFAGASGVGKSTLMNALFPELLLSTGEVSRKIERGRHTTRHVELFKIGGGRCGFLADTPGFSLIDFARFDFFPLESLIDNFPDIKAFSSECRYDDCSHVGESACECAVARAAAEGRLAPSRLESYRSIYRILKEKKNSY